MADVLNFALKLGYLKAQFYGVATTGNTLGSTVIGGANRATGGTKAPLTGLLADIAAEIAQDAGSNSSLCGGYRRMLSATVLMRNYKAKNDNPDLAGILDGAHISSNRTGVKINFRPSNDQLLGLIEHNTFASRP